MFPRILALCLALAVALLPDRPAAQEATGTPAAAFAGTYEGWVDSGGLRTGMVTTFGVAIDGALKGGYAFDEPDRVVQGSVAVTAIAGDMLEVVWRDLYGEGAARLVFTPNRASFEGLWYDPQGQVGGLWTGCRIDEETGRPDIRCPAAPTSRLEGERARTPLT